MNTCAKAEDFDLGEGLSMGTIELPLHPFSLPGGEEGSPTESPNARFGSRDGISCIFPRFRHKACHQTRALDPVMTFPAFSPDSATWVNPMAMEAGGPTSARPGPKVGGVWDPPFLRPGAEGTLNRGRS